MSLADLEARAKSTAAAIHEVTLGIQQWISMSDLGQAHADKMNARGSPSGTTAIPVSEGLNPISGQLLDAEGYAAGSYKVTSYDLGVARQMDDIVGRLNATFGPGNFFAAQIAAVSTFIKEGRFSGVVGLAYLRAILHNWDAGLGQEIADPKNSPAMKLLDYELQAFIHGANI